LPTIAFVAVCAIAGLAASLFWPTARTEPEVTWNAPAPAGVVGQPRTQWSHGLAVARLLGVYASEERVVVAGLPDEGDIDLGDPFTLTAYDRSSGSEVWSWESELTSLSTAPVVVIGEDVVIVAQPDGEVDALDTRSGASRWSRSASGAPALPQAESGVVVAFRAEPESFDIVDIRSGAELWTGSSDIEPLGVTGDVLLGIVGDDVVRFDLRTGAERDRFEGLAPVGGERIIAIGEGQVLRFSADEVTSALPGQAIRWDWSSRQASLLAVSGTDGVVHLARSDGWTGLDEKSGRELWARQGSGTLVNTGRPFVLLDRSREVGTYDAKTGKELGFVVLEEIEEGGDRAVAVSADVLYVSDGVTLTGYSLPSLEKLWEHQLGDGDAPNLWYAVDGGVVVVHNGMIGLLA
jgi:outer membrane protein assembly factor BamB